MAQKEREGSYLSDKVFSTGGKYEQFRFGKRKTIIKGGPQRPMPRWDKVREEMRRESEIRKHTDRFKEIIFSMSPDATMFTVYGMALINNTKQRFSFDVCFTRENKQQKYQIMKELYDRMYAGQMPRNYYYGFYFGENVLKSKFISHEGIVEMTQKYKKKDREKMSSWRPKSHEIKSEKKIAKEIAVKLRGRERYERIKRTMRFT